MPEKPIIDYGQHVPWTRKQPSAGAIYWLLGIAVVGCMVVWFFGHWTERKAAYHADKNNCGYTIRTISRAAYVYATKHESRLPPDLQTLVSWQTTEGSRSSDPVELVCPGSHDQAFTSADDIAKPGHCSYIYVGAGLSTSDGWDRAMAIEDPANHDMQGGYVLLNMLSFNTRFYDLPLLMQCFEDLEAGKNPPSTQTSLTWSAARKLYDTKWKARMPQLKRSVWQIPQTRPTTQP